MKFLRYDSPFMTLFRKAVDYLLLGLLWLLACVPVITFGAATTAMLRTAEVSIHKEEGSGIFVPFLKYFVKEFKQATLLWLIQLPILAISVFYFVLVWKSEMAFILMFLSYVLIALLFTWTQLWFGYQSKFEDSLKTVLVNSLRIALSNMGRSIVLALLLILLVLGSCVAVLVFQPILLFLPGLYVFAYSSIFRKLAEKLIPNTENVLLN